MQCIPCIQSTLTGVLLCSDREEFDLTCLGKGKEGGGMRRKVRVSVKTRYVRRDGEREDSFDD